MQLNKFIKSIQLNKSIKSIQLNKFIHHFENIVLKTSKTVSGL